MLLGFFKQCVSATIDLEQKVDQAATLADDHSLTHRVIISFVQSVFSDRKRIVQPLLESVLIFLSLVLSMLTKSQDMLQFVLKTLLDFPRNLLVDIAVSQVFQVTFPSRHV